MDELKCLSSAINVRKTHINWQNDVVASTPIIKKEVRGKSRDRVSSGQAKIPDGRCTEEFLLESRKAWPLAFSEACQEYLDILMVNSESEIVIHDPQARKCRSREKILYFTRRDRSHDRSLSPGGALCMKESKWDRNAEIVVLLIDEIIIFHKNSQDETLFSRDNYAEAKELVEKLTKMNDNESRLIVLKLCKPSLLVQILRYSLGKLGLLVPPTISQQFLLLRALIERDGDTKVLRRDNITAVQTLLFNTSSQSRIVLRKVLTLFSIFYKENRHFMTRGKLMDWLRPSLFEGDSNGSQQKLCHDLVALSECLFKAPSGLEQKVKDKVNSRICKGVVIPASSSTQQQLSPPDTFTTRHNFIEVSSIKCRIDDLPKNSNKRHSFSDKTKKFCKRALSPLRPIKGPCNIDKFYCQIKKTKVIE